ncbi:hypothetical protein SISSUDRAFT_1064335 [Sistotremastrum suecicum HHB10207 ss-3]|uniref:Concanavalin A-like lectin/glucanase n=1 Tax=Sistotremastrum suecicum HHB10207 ss-3 TaxID=1314776 RepID=A0A166AR74_9AGAM|nr:hypothetical protein SISSUDRAFT_1064335 [Sistotremastrum suecicum HHB10207 ss-3]
MFSKSYIAFILFAAIANVAAAPVAEETTTFLKREETATSDALWTPTIWGFKKRDEEAGPDARWTPFIWGSKKRNDESGPDAIWTPSVWSVKKRSGTDPDDAYTIRTWLKARDREVNPDDIIYFTVRSEAEVSEVSEDGANPDDFWHIFNWA